MFDENVEELSLSDSHISFTVKCMYLASAISQTLTFNSVPHHVDTKHDETQNEWHFKAPRFALGILRTL